MSFTVVWKPRAERQLAEIWDSAQDRGAVTRAADQMDAELKQQAETLGESREDLQSRILFNLPLAIAFRVHRDDLRVEVLRVWIPKRRPL
jgi:plasmid stabilization system protein ParE